MKYSLFVILMALSGTSFAQSEERHLEEVQQKWANAKLYTLALAESMPAETYDFRPVAGEMTFGQQVLHLSSNMVWLCSSYLTEDKPPVSRDELDSKEARSKEDILTLLKTSLHYAETTLQEFDPKKLDESVKFFAGPLTKRQIIMLMNDHLTHHRAQAIVYLRLNGIAPPAYVGW